MSSQHFTQTEGKMFTLFSSVKHSEVPVYSNPSKRGELNQTSIVSTLNLGVE